MDYIIKHRLGKNFYYLKKYPHFVWLYVEGCAPEYGCVKYQTVGNTVLDCGGAFYDC